MIYQGKNFAIDLAKIAVFTGLEGKSDKGTGPVGMVSIYVDGSDDPLLIDLEDGLKILEAWKQLHAPKLADEEDLKLLAEWCDTCWDLDLGDSIRKRAWRQR